MNIALHLTIFGGTGDLTFRKLLPALYMMDRTGALPEGTRVLIIGRRDYTTEQYREEAHGWISRFSRIEVSDAAFGNFAEKIIYYRMDFTDQGAYHELGTYYARDEIAEHLFYLAVAPHFFADITAGLRQIPGTERGKVVIEKPFGDTLPLAKKLNEDLTAFFGRDHIYRIDHYLGKEMIRNIQTIRFFNQVFANVWNHDAIASVEISALEEVGVETRGGYYDVSGAMKDMVQNHLFQVMTILAMEKPQEFTAEEIHAEQLKVLKALIPPTRENIADSLVLGQYAGYREEPKVNPESETETFAAMKLYLDLPRWQGTPFYIRTGKKTGVRETEVLVTFRSTSPEAAPDVLRIEIQPREGVVFRFNIKQPGESTSIIPVEMDFCQSCNIEFHRNTPEAYERLLSACIQGDQSWFSQWDQIETSWTYIEALRQLARESGLVPLSYEPGRKGPEEAVERMKAAGSGKQ